MIDPCTPIRHRLSPARVRAILRWNKIHGAPPPVPPAPCVRAPTRTVPAFVATPPAAAALPKLAIAAGLGVAGTAGAAGIVALGTRLAAGPASSAATAQASVTGPSWTELQIPTTGMRTSDAPPVTSVPEPASVLVLMVPVLVVVLLGRGFRRA